MFSMFKSLAVAGVLAGSAFVAQPARADRFSVGVSIPVASSYYYQPSYAPPVTYYAPSYSYSSAYCPPPVVYSPPVVYAPAPIYYPAPTYYYPPTYYYSRPSIGFSFGFGDWGRGWGGDHGGGGHRR